MIALETAAQVKYCYVKRNVLDNLSNTGLKYIDQSMSSYSGTYLTLASIMLTDYPQLYLVHQNMLIEVISFHA